MDSESIEATFARRDRYRRALMKRVPPEERLQRFWAVQEHAKGVLAKNPEGYRRFLHRNLHDRAIADPPEAFDP